MALEIEEEKGKEKAAGGKKEENVSLSTDAMKLISQLQDEVAELRKEKSSSQGGLDESLVERLVNKLTGAEKARTGQFEFDTMHYESDIDPDDALDEEKWVTFVCHKTMYVIVDDKRNGHNIRAPFDKIVFKYQYTKRIKNGKETDLVNLSMYVCKSKKELKWLREHSMFGIMFFDNISGAVSIDADRASRLARQMIALQKVGQHQLISMVKSRNLPVSSDLNTMRSLVAHHVVEQQMAAERGLTERMLMEQKLEQEALQ